MITTVGCTKGGVGKTTLAINTAIALALEGQDVLLIDGDEQATATGFSQIRSTDKPDHPQYTAIQLQGPAIRAHIRRVTDRFNVSGHAASSYDQVVIDVGGRDSGSLRAALTVSDLIIIPVAPRSFDVWGLRQTLELVREVRALNPGLRALAVVNNGDATGNRNQEALEALAEFDGLEVSPHILMRRLAYSSAADEGLSVLEHVDRNNRRGSAAAREDFTQLFKSIYPNFKRRKLIA